MRKYITAGLTACIMTGAAALATAKVVDRTLAIVNNEPIMYSEYEKTTAPIIEQYQASTPKAEQTPEKLKELKTKLLDQMVDDRLLRQEAEKQKIKITKRELEEGTKQIRKRFTTEDEFQAELKKEGLTQAQFDKRIEDQLKVMKLIETDIKAKTPAPTDQEVRAFYDQIQQKMAGKDLGLPKEEEDQIAALAKYLTKLTSEQVRASHILVAVDKNATADKKASALKKIKQVQAELKNGADFDELARKYSDDPGSKTRGGDLGFFSKGDMVPEFEKEAFALNVGQVSEPVLTDFGYHLIKVTEKRAPRKLSFDDVRNDLKDLLFQKAAQKRYDSWMKDLRAKSNIKINPIEG